MDRQLHLGGDLRLPLDAVTETFVVVGKRGSGKTSTGTVLAEEMLEAGQHVVVIDPTGVWWGLRSSATGRSDGYPIAIFGGDHGDVPLEAGSGALVADLVVSQQLPAVLDLSNLSKAKQRTFNTAFLERLYHANRKPMHVIVDEADTIAPQRPVKGSELLLGAADDLVRRGRVRGLGVTLITQRPAVLSKDVMTQASTLIAMQLTGPQDRDAVDGWVSQDADEQVRRQLLDSLASLPVGTGWLWSPGWLEEFVKVPVRRRRTFDSSQTPKVGALRATPKQYATVNLEVVRRQMDELAEASAGDDTAQLRRELADVRCELEAAQKGGTPVEVEAEVFDPAVANRLLGELDEVGRHLDALAAQVHSMRAAVAEAGEREPGKAAPSGTPARTVAPPPARSTNGSRPRGPRPSVSDGDVELEAGARRMLATLAQPPGIVLTKAQIGTLAKIRVTGGTFSTYWSALARNGLVEASGDGFVITDAGVHALGDRLADTPTTAEEAAAMWDRHLKAGARTMLHGLVDVYPAALSRDGLADAAGLEPTGGTFRTHLSTLRRAGLVEVDGGDVRAADPLYVYGRRAARRVADCQIAPSARARSPR